MSITPKELEIPFSPVGVDKPCVTYCKVFGDLSSHTKRPLVVVHGGPGMCHDYLLPIADLAAGGTPVVFYDQLGGGRSTHLPERNGDTAFWTETLFMDEFDNLVRHLEIEKDFDVLGQSWGGMLMSRYAATRPLAGLHRLVIANSPISMELWIEAANELRGQLPQEVQTAMLAFYAQFVCRVTPMPADFMTCFKFIEEDPTVYFTMNGPSEFHITGSLKTWSMLDDAAKIAVPTLLINGFYDEARDSTVAPWFERIPHVRWVTLPQSSHMPQFEEREKYMQIVSTFLHSH